jgi:NAD(P)-dependent dehydrogenase (short-subunit alcohol dehydrogenase family)
MQDFKNRVAVVTGAASGIGLALSERFLAEGMRVVLADVEPERLATEVKRLTDAGGDVLGVRCDVRDSDSVEALRDETLSSFGAVHVLLNNAGVAPAGSMIDSSPADWRWIVEVNVLGVAYGVSAFGPAMREAGEGHIVNTASEAGLATSASLGSYGATKHAVVGLTESLYRELAETNVGVHCLCPNLVRTKIFESERNRDDGAAMTASHTATIAPLREAINALGISPADVASDVIDAMRDDRFWIFTHDITPQSAASRFRDIAANANPSDPYANIEVSEELSNLT